MIERTPCVDMSANRKFRAMYVGVTSNLVGQIAQHREGRFDGLERWKSRSRKRRY
jgi:predicted GIY-YIG superfamily endonuclease